MYVKLCLILRILIEKLCDAVRCTLEPNRPQMDTFLFLLIGRSKMVQNRYISWLRWAVPLECPKCP
jgi:hypothetical protein